MTDVRVVGHAVSDVIHLLAELIENAAAFSPPGTRVQVAGELAARHGIKVRLRRSWFGGVAALVPLPSSLLGGPEAEMEPAGPAPAPVPRAFAVRSPGAGHDDGTAG